MKFISRFEKIKGVKKAVYIPSKLHLTIFYKEGFSEEEIKEKVIGKIRDSNFENSVETISFYEE